MLRVVHTSFALAWAIATVACHSPATVAPPSSSPSVDARVIAIDAPPAAIVVEPISDSECERYVDHVLQLGQDVMRKTKPVDEVPTSEQVAAIRARLLVAKPCRDLSRPLWTCAIAATDAEAVRR
jgi:hypothetical protein